MNLILFSAIWGVGMMLGGLFIKNRSAAKNIALLGALLLASGNLLELNGFAIFKTDFNGMLDYSRFGLIYLTVLSVALIFYFLLSGKEIEAVGKHPYEYFALLFFVMSGVGLVALFNNLLVLFLGIEIISIPLYILTGSDKRNLKSNEAALKYFLMGAFSTGIFLLGIAFLYGGSGSFRLQDLMLQQGDQYIVLVLIGVVLLLISLSFKVSAAPFHFWTPDVYDGAPTIFTSFMATIVKAAFFIGFLKVFSGAFSGLSENWRPSFTIIIVLTLLIGNITAVYQQSVKRMLAYSSIAQAGFMLFSVYASNDLAEQSLLLYAAAYCLSTIGLFAVLIKMNDYTFEGFNGLAKKEPLLAFVATVCVLSLAGIPLTAGFFAKFYVLSAAMKSGANLWLVIFAVIMAAVSVYYYFRVIAAMYFKDGGEQVLVTTPVYKWGLMLLVVLILLLGIIPESALLNWLVLY
jgi:NADH-quinone oxidoreductase subunit N